MRGRSVKVVLEDIDEAELQLTRSEVECRGLLNAAKGEGRDLTAGENAVFNAAIGTAKMRKERLEQLRNELSQAEKTEQQIIQQSTWNPQGQNSMQRHTSGTGIYNQANSGAPNLQLPVNGELPAGGYADQNWRLGNGPHAYLPQVRSKRLRAFNTEVEALAGGMFLRSIEARLSGRGLDATAEEALKRFGMEISNSSYEGSGTSGGYLVPPQISQTIIEVRERVGIARQVCQIYQMTGDTISIPKRAGGLTVYYPAELAAITDSDKSWSHIACNARKRAVACKISQELMDDALISIADNVFSEMAYALALQEDNELCNGTGASTYGGVLGLRSAIGTAGIYTADANENLWSEIDLEDVIYTMAKLPDRFNRSPVWICSSNFFWSVFARLAATSAGNNIASLEGGPTGKQFLGVPVLTTSSMPTADADSTIHALFGQFDMGVILADRTGIRIGRDDSVGFLSDYTTLKATARYDMNVHEPGTTAVAGAYVALKTNAA